MALIKIEMKRTADYLNEIARTTDLFYELSPQESEGLKQCFLSIYKDINDVCQNYGLTLMLGAGSVLGAVRHQGFIPWDDDFDMLMPRNDFNTLISLFHKELSDKYILSVPRIDKESKTLFMQIIKKNTVLTCVDDLSRTDANGIRVDIYVIEKMPDNYFIRIMKCYCLDILRIIAISTNIYDTNNELFKKCFLYSLSNKIYYYIRIVIGFLFSFLGRKRLYDFFDYFASSSTGQKYCTVPTGRRMSKGEMLPSQAFFPPSKGIFEGLEVNLPHDPHTYLSNMYGNYMQMPPVDKRERHFCVEFNLGDFKSQVL